MRRSFSTIREWCKLASVFAGSAQTRLLKGLAHALAQRVVSVKSGLPSWSVCFDPVTSRMHENVAYKVLCGKVAAIAANHNILHQLLSDMGRAAKMLEVVPRLQEHELTNGEVASALETLKVSSQASVVCLAVDLVKTYKNDVAGPRRRPTS